MEEEIEKRIILILTILTVIFFLVAVRSCSDVQKYRKAKDKETAFRFEIEDKMNKFLQEKQGYEEKVKNAFLALEEEKAAHQASKKALVQEQLVDQSLKEELEKVTKLKEALEEDLKEALTGSKSKTKR